MISLLENMTRRGGSGRFELYEHPSWPLFLAMVLALLCYLFVRWLTHWPGRQSHLKFVQRASAFAPDYLAQDKKYDTIVIGSGSGGCACANLLAQAGQRVLLLEQHPDRTGGCTHSFRIEGCEWDTGLHYTSMGMSKRTQRPGALLHFMTKGKQAFTRLQGKKTIMHV
jgi:NAD(P)-binding Rossmann-like domain